MDPHFTNAEDCIKKAGLAGLDPEDQVIWLLEAQSHALLALTETVFELVKKLGKGK